MSNQNGGQTPPCGFNFASRYIEMRMRRVHLTMRTEGIKRFQNGYGVVVWTGENDTITILVDANRFENGAKQLTFRLKTDYCGQGLSTDANLHISSVFNAIQAYVFNFGKHIATILKYTGYPEFISSISGSHIKVILHYFMRQRCLNKCQ